MQQSIQKKALLEAFFRRAFLLLSLSAVLVLLVSEAAYWLNREETSRSPQIIELAIPAGAADRVAAGEEAPGIPEEMVFVNGDTLLVKNEDRVNHELGPLYIPAGQTASLFLGEANNFTYSCSFRPSQYLNLTVREAVTWKSRLGALWYGTMPTWMFLLVYSFVVRPLKVTQKAT